MLIPEDISDIAKICADCGNCLYECPVYKAELIEPGSPRGKVNLLKGIIDGTLSNTSISKKYIYQCLLCGSCEDICTKGVNYIDMMINYRGHISKNKKIPFIKKIILSIYQSFIYKRLLFAIDLLSIRSLKKRFLIPVREKTVLKDLYSNDKDKVYDILFFPGCVLTDFYPKKIERSIQFLKSKGYSVLLIKDISCCGFPYLSQGWKDRSDKFMNSNLVLFKKYTFKKIVIPCGTCTMTLKKYYNISQDIPVYEMTDFIFKFIKDAKLNKEFKSKKITYHDPCHNINSLKIKDQPRYFLKQAENNFIDDDSRTCCGFGGVFSVGFPSTSKKILENKKEVLNSKGTETVITSCPGCYMQLKENLDQEVKFFIDIF